MLSTTHERQKEQNNVISNIEITVQTMIHENVDVFFSCVFFSCVFVFLARSRKIIVPTYKCLACKFEIFNEDLLSRILLPLSFFS